MLPTATIGVNYMTGMNLQNIITGLQKKKNKAQDFKQYPRQKSYILKDDWEVNTENGGLVLTNKQKKKNQGKILKFVLKKFLTTGSFMGISFPVFAMKPESILETYAKSIAAAPLLFDENDTQPTERMKKFVCFVFTFSKLFTDMDKPFNPVIGQTFQAQIAGGLYTAQQTSHHPPQSSFHYQGNGYTIYGTLELGADIGVNSAHGLFYGDIHVQFQKRGKIFGRVLSGEMSGFVLGENKFLPRGSSYAYDPINKIICTYKRETKDHFVGLIGTLKQKYQQRFNQTLKSSERFTKFEAFKQKDFECILSNMQACWTRNVSFNKKVYIDFDDPQWLPFEPTHKNLKLLPSDSRNRKDIQLKAQNNLTESQKQKQKIEDLERYFRKLRKGEKNAKIEKDEIERIQEQQLIDIQ